MAGVVTGLDWHGALASAPRGLQHAALVQCLAAAEDGLMAAIKQLHEDQPK